MRRDGRREGRKKGEEPRWLLFKKGCSGGTDKHDKQKDTSHNPACHFGKRRQVTGIRPEDSPHVPDIRAQGIQGRNKKNREKTKLSQRILPLRFRQDFLTHIPQHPVRIFLKFKKMLRYKMFYLLFRGVLFSPALRKIKLAKSLSCIFGVSLKQESS